MKSIDVYKSAVMRRAEDKRRARERAVRRTLAVCLPLCLCLGIVGATTLPIGEDHAPDMNGGLCIETSDATVRHGNTVIAVMDDADAVYNGILALYQPDGNLTGNSYGGVDDLTDGADAESFPEAPSDSGSENGSAAYYLHFPRPEGERVFLLRNLMLTDLTSGSTAFITEEQAQALVQGETP